ncbi:MAG: hypothetical protein VKM17_08130 [Cyanobacteriota bacterium]|nr:hypothetical protein [Cyanobacteriota bacterium]
MSPLQLAAFGLASLAVMGNDALQTLGPFLASQRWRRNRLAQGLFLGGVLCAVLLLSWKAGSGDPAWGRLESFPLPPTWRWTDLLPLLTLLALTRLGLPVSTSFLVLTAVAPMHLGGMLRKSLAGYGLAFLLAALVYGLLAPWLEGSPPAPGDPPIAEPTYQDPHPPAGQRAGAMPWAALQWLATAGLWSQWLVQDLANLYVVLPRRLSLAELGVTLIVLCGTVALIVCLGGGPIQGRLRSKCRMEDPRSTTVVSLLYGLVLLAFLGGDRLPLSTSWLFLGLLAGREVGLGCRGLGRPARALLADLSLDLLRAGAGLATSLAVALLVAADRA